LRATWNAEFPLSRMRVSGGTLWCDECRTGFSPSERDDGLKPVLHFAETSFRTRQRKIASERIDLAADSGRHLRATARAALRAGGFELAGALTEGRRMSVGGAASSIEPQSLFIERVLDPALDRDTLFGQHYRGERAELRSGPFAAFWQRHSANRTIDVIGLEGRFNRDPMPIVKAAGLDLTVGIARVRPEQKTRAWIAMRWHP